MRTILLRVYVAYMAAAQTLFVKYGEAADPYMTLVGYFNSMRELGGMRRVADDSLRTRLMRMDNRGLAKRSMTSFGVDELTSRKGATDIPKIRNRLGTPFEPGAARKKKSKDKSNSPLDVVLATNMISVGLDIPRLGLMVVLGQPKTHAEYIQATSRVGRDDKRPGLVVTLLVLIVATLPEATWSSLSPTTVPRWLEGVTSAVAFAVPLVYFSALWAMTGQTAGGLATGTVVEHRDGFRLSFPHALARAVAKALAASLIMGLVVVVVNTIWAMLGLTDRGIAWTIAQLAVTVIAGGAAFVATAWVLKMEELRAMLNMVRRRRPLTEAVA